MAAVIALRPETDRGREILDELEKRTEMQPEQVIEDGTRRYHLSAEDADADALDPILNKIDPNWRDDVTDWREGRGFPWDAFFGAHPVD